MHIPFVDQVLVFFLSVLQRILRISMTIPWLRYIKYYSAHQAAWIIPEPLYVLVSSFHDDFASFFHSHILHFKQLTSSETFSVSSCDLAKHDVTNPVNFSPSPCMDYMRKLWLSNLTKNDVYHLVNYFFPTPSQNTKTNLHCILILVLFIMESISSLKCTEQHWLATQNTVF